jgi:hypothetical protein
MSEEMEPLAAKLRVEAKGDGTEATVIVEGELDKSGASSQEVRSNAHAFRSVP